MRNFNFSGNAFTHSFPRESFIALRCIILSLLIAGLPGISFGQCPTNFTMGHAGPYGDCSYRIEVGVNQQSGTGVNVTSLKIVMNFPAVVKSLIVTRVKQFPDNNSGWTQSTDWNSNVRTITVQWFPDQTDPNNFVNTENLSNIYNVDYTVDGDDLYSQFDYDLSSGNTGFRKSNGTLCTPADNPIRKAYYIRDFSGTITTPWQCNGGHNGGLENVYVRYKNLNDNVYKCAQYTDSYGAHTCTGNNNDCDYRCWPLKVEDVTCGININDVIEVNNHIQNYSCITDVIKLYAADADDNWVINGNDVNLITAWKDGYHTQGSITGAWEMIPLSQWDFIYYEWYPSLGSTSTCRTSIYSHDLWIDIAADYFDRVDLDFLAIKNGDVDWISSRCTDCALRNEPISSRSNNFLNLEAKVINDGQNVEYLEFKTLEEYNLDGLSLQFSVEGLDSSDMEVSPYFTPKMKWFNHWNINSNSILLTGLNNVPLNQRILKTGSTILRLKVNKKISGRKAYLTYPLINSNEAAVNDNSENIKVKVIFDLFTSTFEKELNNESMNIVNDRIMYNPNLDDLLLSIYISSGQLLLNWGLDNNLDHDFNVSKLVSGFYIAVVENGSKKFKIYKLLKL